MTGQGQVPFKKKHKGGKSLITTMVTLYLESFKTVSTLCCMLSLPRLTSTLDIPTVTILCICTKAFLKQAIFIKVMTFNSNMK